MQYALNLSDQIHQKAIDASARYLRAESELIEILQQVEQHQVFLRRGHSSLFAYVVKELGLSGSVAYNLISVSRKAREVPELKAEIQEGNITLSNARKIVPVLNQENKTEWLKKAREASVGSFGKRHAAVEARSGPAQPSAKAGGHTRRSIGRADPGTFETPRSFGDCEAAAGEERLGSKPV